MNTHIRWEYRVRQIIIINGPDKDSIKKKMPFILYIKPLSDTVLSEATMIYKYFPLRDKILLYYTDQKLRPFWLFIISFKTLYKTFI